MLARQEIREAIVATLQSSASVTSLVGNKIYNSKMTPFEGKVLPAINVVTQRQNATARSLNVMSFDCSLEINVEIYVSPRENWVTKADEIAEAVENTLMSNTEFIGLFSKADNFNVNYSMYDQGAMPIVVEILSFTLTYFEEYPIKEDNNLSKVHIDVDVIDPVANPSPGPDSRIEFQIDVNNKGE